jgi:hypothetical protein
MMIVGSLGILRAAMFAEPTIAEIEKVICLVHKMTAGGQWSDVI